MANSKHDSWGGPALLIDQRAIKTWALRGRKERGRRVLSATHFNSLTHATRPTRTTRGEQVQGRKHTLGTY